MKQILLIRHAKSSKDDISIADIDRPLNDRGKREAVMVGQLLKEKKIFPQLIISSPAKRAIKTAFKIIKVLNYPKKNIEVSKIIYSGDINQIVEYIQSISKKIDRVFIVGHNPRILELANFLAGSNLEELLTSGLVLIDFKLKSWKDVAKGSGKIAFQDKAF